MDHSQMGHNMDHSGGHAMHAGHNAAENNTATTLINAVLNATTPSTAGMDHNNHMNMMMGGGGGGMSGMDGMDMMDHGDHTTEDHSGHTTMGMDHDMGGMGMHSMSFHFGYDETILFDSWKINSVGGLIGSMIGIFILAALYEGLKYYREHLFRKTFHTVHYSTVSVPVDHSTVKETHRTVQSSMFSWFHMIQTSLHILQVVTSYLLMLVFMTYNVWLCIAVALGAATGYFLFGWKKSIVVDITEHCH